MLSVKQNYQIRCGIVLDSDPTTRHSTLASGALLTYMSIRNEIMKHVAERRLFEVVPGSHKDAHIRRLFVTPEVQKLLLGPWTSDQHKIRATHLLTDFQGFSAGRDVRVSLTGRKHQNAMFGRMEEPRDEVWEFRHQVPSPGLRTTGRFADRDWFVATELYPRSVRVDWIDKEPIANDEDKYAAMIKDCQRRWNELFPNFSPRQGGSVDDYLSRASSI